MADVKERKLFRLIYWLWRLGLISERRYEKAFLTEMYRESLQMDFERKDRE